VAGRGKILVSLSALAPGDLVLREVPALAVTQAMGAPSTVDLKAWVDGFATLAPGQRAEVLALHCPELPTEGGALEGLSESTLPEAVQLPPELHVEEAWRFLRIVECNTFQVPRGDGRVDVELLLATARLNHSCFPNALRGPGKEAGTTEVRALRPVPVGQELTISYIGEELLFRPTSERQARLQAQWQFLCGCERCFAPDPLRAFRCQHCSKGFAYALPDGSLAACAHCGRHSPAEATEAALAAEQSLAAEAPAALRAAHAAAGQLNRALTARDSPALEASVKASMAALAQMSAAVKGEFLALQHHLVAGLAKPAAALRTLLGDSLQAGGRTEIAHNMWKLAAEELGAAVAAERNAVDLPRDERAADLVGLSGVHKRLGRKEEAQRCLTEALTDMRLVYWACEPAQRRAVEGMMSGVEAALADEVG